MGRGLWTTCLDFGTDPDLDLVFPIPDQVSDPEIFCCPTQLVSLSIEEICSFTLLFNWPTFPELFQVMVVPKSKFCEMLEHDLSQAKYPYSCPNNRSEY